MTGEVQRSSPRTASHDSATVDAQWREHRRWVAAVLLAHMPRHVELEDLLQDVALTFVARGHELREPAALRGWLRTVALNTARMAARRVRLPVVDTSGECGDQLPDPAVERRERQRDAAAEAEQALRLTRELPDPYREALLLRCVDGLSQKRIAETLGVPETTVETRLARARRMLRDKLERASAPTAC
jgi:RNA polymerase sigma-70 factor (ECF subfamily)